ncbi:efflux RND transporter periplasmic adaptor subunit [Aphanothece sacrum]|uniref:Efflux transporter, RND family protein n=1 Tax=Aphanothece sacrum FPU1 TaxID=1920663 RepID=A0A401IKY5_APHSA|nr:efflux RND transporter periplasmic adaptor subunit [Aphanothece sacrum]GBF81914.1 efflux transporter, RND family protein [Aphanothece sacrum FPU1]GBF83544.1 Efflux transporter, RND family, MFP subunit [Aphanothece sacrum FPU3]
MEVPVFGKFNRPLPWILALMTGGILVLGVSTYRMIQTPTVENEIDKMTVTIQRETLGIEIKASGTVEPIQSVNISPKNPGRLVQLRVEQGMPVKAGQILAIMENTEIRAQGKQAEANYQQTLANLSAAKTRIPSEINQAQTRYLKAKSEVEQAQANLEQVKQRIPKDIQQIESQLRAADGRYRLAASRVKRNEELMKEGAITQDSFDAVSSEYINAKATVVETLQKLEQTKNTAPPELGQLEQQIRQSQASVAEAKIAFEERKQTAQAEIAQLQAAAAANKAELERIVIQFQDTAIRAPFDGIVTQKFATQGAFVTPTTSASSTASATSSSIVALARGLKVVAKVPEVDIGNIQPGQPVSIIADAFPNETFQGQVIRIAPEAIVDQNVTSFEVTIGLITGRDKLLSKMNVDVSFLGQQLNQALVVPTVAIVTQEGKTGVMVPDAQNKPEFKPITIGLVLDDKTEILSGLTPGDRVFIDLPEQPNKKDNKDKKPE